MDSEDTKPVKFIERRSGLIICTSQIIYVEPHGENRRVPVQCNPEYKYFDQEKGEFRIVKEVKRTKDYIYFDDAVYILKYPRY